MKNKVCPNSPGYHRGVYVSESGTEVKAVRRQVPCKSWRCPVCNPKKVKQLRKRAFKGPMANIESKPGYRPSPYLCKMFTLTIPGKDFRSSYTPEQALGYIQEKGLFNCLMNAFKKRFGSDFEYFKVIEPHDDGYPHIHVLMVGESVIPKETYSYINYLWHEVYGMGFTYVTLLTKGPKYAVNYTTKYLTKISSPIKKHARLFTSSRNALEPIPKFKPRWIQNNFQLGRSGLPDKQVAQSIPAFTVPQVVWDALSEQLKWSIYPELFTVVDEFLYDDKVPF